MGDNQLFDFIATSPPLEVLSLHSNPLNDDDISMLSEALKQNTTLITLLITSNQVTDAGCASLAEAMGENSTLRCINILSREITNEGCKILRRAMFDESSLNAVADSNHTCEISGLEIRVGLRDINSSGFTPKINRGDKIYWALSSRNEECSNVHHLNQEMNGEDSMKLVPKVLAIPALRRERRQYSMPLSIMYELLRSWKMPSLYDAPNLDVPTA